jgi:hypothetical protein
MAQEMSPQHYAEHVGIPPSTVDDWIQGRGAVLFDPRDLREVHSRLKLIAVQAPNGAGLGARPRFIPNPAYKYERKRKSVHETRGGRPVEIVPVQGAGVPGVPHPAPQDVQGDAALGVVGGEGMAEALEVADGEAGARHG